MPNVRLLLSSLIIAVPALAACGTNENITAFAGATVIDGTGGPPILDGVIVVQNGRIEAIGRPDEVNVPRGGGRDSLLV